MENNTNTSENMNSSDENSCSYSKYDKDEPELKGPITSFSQYEEYVQEFQDKFDSYVSLSRILVGYRDEFKKLAVESEDAKARGDMDRYNEIRDQIKEFHMRKPRFTRMKKIYLVLHAELPSITQRVEDFFDERRKRWKADNAEVGSQKKLTDMSSKFRYSESRANQDIDLDGRSESNRRVPGHASKHDTKRGVVSHPVKESKGQTPNSCEEVADEGKDSVLADKDNRDQKNRESSSDEYNCSYLKYDKDEPELKGPITSYTQYREYMQEFQDKYDSYLSLNKILVGYSKEFKKLAVEYEDAKAKGDMDRSNEIWEQTMESYRRCGARFNKVKKIFLLLHVELPSIKQRIEDFNEEYTKD